ncbi:hypothetical protein ACQP1O_29150 [Nocardia sp. CA-151230]|uniref:hypothetical protein n=1 Tax=Nocardia sp. CA-151230 TaxID=3239982 RepID=UPI003D8B1247
MPWGTIHPTTIATPIVGMAYGAYAAHVEHHSSKTGELERGTGWSGGRADLVREARTTYGQTLSAALDEIAAADPAIAAILATARAGA